MRQREMERDVSLAWHSAAFAGARKLKPLSHYLKALKAADDSRGAEAVLGALRAMAKQGVPMTIRKVA